MNRRRLISLLMALFCAMIAVAPRAAAQGAQQTTFDERTRKELQEWASIVWEYYDTGQVPARAATFKFSNPKQFPRWFQPFNPALSVFKDIYRHRLTAPGQLDGFTIEDLLASDPAVRDHFREFTTTGVLRTPIDEDPQAAANHVERLQEAEAGGSKEYTLLGDWEVKSLAVVSTGLVTKKKIPNPPAPNPGTPVPPGFPGDLKREWDDSDIDKMPYKPDGWPWQPGFDCDDYADALAAWLKKHMLPNYPGMTIDIIWITWFGGGHAIVRVCYEGTCYYIDPQTGEILPCPTGCTVKDIIDWFNRIGYGIGDPWLPGWEIKDPNERPLFEPGPWWEDEELRRQIERETGHPWEDFVWNGIIAEPHQQGAKRR